MITSSFSLAFNGKALLNNSKEMLWQRDIYLVTTSTDGHGTLIAFPMSGVSGTNVTLSNTPNVNYTFTGYSITGAILTGNQFVLNNDVTVWAGFILPSNTVRVRTNDGNPPIKDSSTTYETATLVPGTTDVYDVYRSGTNFRSLLHGSTNVVEVLDANTTGITNMAYMFSNCSSLISVSLFDTSAVTNMGGMFGGCKFTTVPLFDTSNVTDMYDMFQNCKSLLYVPVFNTSNVTNMNRMFYSCSLLTAVPLFNTSNVTNTEYMFFNCRNVQSGALALYQQASTQAIPPKSHSSTFYNCGSNTTTGAAELAQIPSDWK